MKLIYLLTQKINAYLRRTPVAWLQLSHQKVRLLVAILGVAFSIILIFTQLGLRGMLFNGVTLLPENLNGDLYLMSNYAEVIRDSSVPNIFLYQADAVEGVADVRPLYVSRGSWVDPKLLKTANGDEVDADIESSSMQIIAFNPNKPVLNLPEVNQQLNLLAIPSSILYDRLSKSVSGNIPQLFATQGQVFSILDNRRVTVIGLFNLGSTFYFDSVAVMSDWNYKQISEDADLDQVSLGVISLEAGANPQAVIKGIKQTLGKSIKVLTKAELAEAEVAEVATWPEGKVLNFGAGIGFVVGIIIVYQVIYTDVSEHLPEYATLKAMGYKDRDLSLVVLQESLILAVMGFIPGYLTSFGIYYLMTNFIELPVSMNTGIALRVFILTILMCVISGAIAIKKLRTADPADIFY
ncbi:ABC transporter [Pleurocapsa sp. CCALA 161]|uniref:ABC transporter permease DevC n=1 Tax=Pleurocapsa sp. CCALA 161 TaxID=2107688 RepID=UPI000D06AE9A|nr:ABC transporter permease DevC [Pleurocapsa sp. CCALA 161]PSB06214.1 ABC transporter [Pleurocapsa sp. CCALA 161]